jgi:tRNA 2-thiouridine synthesizing protein C
MPVAHVLIRFAHGPHGAARARDGLDAALAMLAWEHRVRVLFEADGVGLIVAVQDRTATGQRDWTRAFRALVLHGVDAIGIDAEALVARGLSACPLMLDAVPLDAAARRAWTGEADVVLAF